MTLLLFACVEPDPAEPTDTGDELPYTEPDRASCSLTVTTTLGGVYDETCELTYDALGRELTYDCLDVQDYGDSWWEADYDALDRVVRIAWWGEYEDTVTTITTEWNGDSRREAHEDEDADEDGVFETARDYAWSCP